jgi:hypothetical protein
LSRSQISRSHTASLGRLQPLEGDLTAQRGHDPSATRYNGTGLVITPPGQFLQRIGHTAKRELEGDARDQRAGRARALPRSGRRPISSHAGGGTQPKANSAHSSIYQTTTLQRFRVKDLPRRAHRVWASQQSPEFSRRRSRSSLPVILLGHPAPTVALPASRCSAITVSLIDTGPKPVPRETSGHHGSSRPASRTPPPTQDPMSDTPDARGDVPPGSA